MKIKLGSLVIIICLLFIWNTAEAKDVENDYDLIVVGSDPEGIAAAVSGARNGLSTLLVDTRPEVGGLMTRGWLNTIDMNYKPNPYGPSTDILNKGIFLEFYNSVEGDSFDVITAQRAFNDLINNEKYLDLMLNVKEIEPIVSGSFSRSKIEGVRIKDEDGGTTALYSKTLIDATQDADIAAQAGVPFSVGQEDMGYVNRHVATTLVFKLSGVSESDWYKIRVALNTDVDPNTGANRVSAWGFGDIMKGFKFKNENLGVRGLNIGRQNDGSVLINALHIYNVNPLDFNGKEKAKHLARQELPKLVNYIGENIPGFSNAYLAGVAPELYVRESRHIYGEYRLTVYDVLGNKDFDDRIAFGSYPVDIQAMGREKRGTILGVPKQYAIPFRSLVPKKVDNMLVVGRSASFDSIAHGSARVIPVGMATGQAAGAAAAISIEENIDFRKMTEKGYIISKLQDRLTEQGMDLQPYKYDLSTSDHLTHEGLKFMLKHGLVSGGYSNNFNLDGTITVGKFYQLLGDLAKIYKMKLPESIEEFSPSDSKLTIDELDQFLPDDKSFLERWFEDLEVLEDIEDKEEEIARGMAFMLIKDYINWSK
ncbi:MAG: FAD-dependent oxidoreductase [Firmicutes bacterium]|nr:FAD-dependent oxidoreductase [Bacillota bacterium]